MSRVEIYIVYIFGRFASAVLDFISLPKANSAAAASIHYLLKSKQQSSLYTNCFHILPTRGINKTEEQ